MRPILVLLGLVVCLASAAAARADALPGPQRPEWDNPPAPLPEPLEEEVWRRLLPAALLAAALLAAGRARKPARRAA